MIKRYAWVSIVVRVVVSIVLVMLMSLGTLASAAKQSALPKELGKSRICG